MKRPSSIPDIKKSRGRPKTNTTAIMLRLPPDVLAAVDTVVGQEADIGRPEAIRMILKRWFTENGMLGERL